MSFLKSFKDKMGIGGASVQLQIPDHVNKADNFVLGTIMLTTKSEQDIVDITIQLVESQTSGSGDKRKTKTHVLGETTLPSNFSIMPSDEKELEFNLPFQAYADLKDLGKDHEGLTGDIINTMGKLASFAGNVRIKHYVEVKVDVKSAWNDPSDKQTIVLM